MELLFVTISLLFLQRSKAANTCSGDIDIIGSDVICPGEVGIYRCIAKNAVILNWHIDQESTTFTSEEQLGSNKIEPVVNGSVNAYLLERSLENSFGNYTSVLFYTPDPSVRRNVTLSCDGGSGDDFCRKRIVVIGTDTIEAPVNVTTTTDKNNIILSWDHENEVMVDHYKIVAGGEQLENEIIRLITTRVVIPRDPNLSYRGTVRAVSLCQQESDARQFQSDSLEISTATTEACMSGLEMSRVSGLEMSTATTEATIMSGAGSQACTGIAGIIYAMLLMVLMFLL